MKEQHWDESIEISKEYIDVAGLLPDDEDVDIRVKNKASKSHVTELRRRIEERLDSKRIDHEYDYDDLDDPPDRLQ
jgi:hypothetical protein